MIQVREHGRDLPLTNASYSVASNQCGEIQSGLRYDQVITHDRCNPCFLLITINGR